MRVSRSPSLRYVRGSAFAMTCMYDGMPSSCQNVPDRNIIGKPITFARALADSGSFAKEPRSIPRLANRTDPTMMKTSVRASNRISTPNAAIATARVTRRERIMDRVNHRILDASHSDFVRVVVERSLKYFRVRYSEIGRAHV